MREPVGDRLTVQILAQAVDVVAARLDLVVLVGGDVPGEDVHRRSRCRETGGDLLGQEEVRPIDSVRPAAIVSWSVSVTSDMPRALQSSYCRAGSA